MKLKNILILLVLLASLLFALFHSLFIKREVPDLDWDVNYYFDNKEPNGGWLLQEILKDSYGNDQVISLKNKFDFPEYHPDASYGYLLIGEYLFLEQSKAIAIMEFIKNGNSAIIIADDNGIYLDSLLGSLFVELVIDEPSPEFTITGDTTVFTHEYYYGTFDTIADYQYTVWDSLNYNDSSLRVLSVMNDVYPVMIKKSIGSGTIYIHSIPSLFSNIGINQEGMKDYTLRALPLLDIDTLYIDNDLWKFKPMPGDNSPLQYVLSQPPLKWAYYITLAGLLLFVCSRGIRRQRIIPILEKNENTSLEFVETLSELYRSQGQHHKLATHIESNFLHWVEKKYIIKQDDPFYIQRLAAKSKMPEADIERLMKRMNAAIGNRHFDEEQLTNLFNDLTKFYKNCK